MFEICLGHVELFLLARSDDNVTAILGIESTRLPASVLNLRHFILQSI
jgi:hypothetical protein